MLITTKYFPKWTAGAVDFDIGTYMLTPVVHHEPPTPDKTGDW